jgi:hypothetical protein
MVKSRFELVVLYMLWNVDESLTGDAVGSTGVSLGMPREIV